MSSPLFKGGLNDFSMPPCANCGHFMTGIRYALEIKGEKVKVCSFTCEVWTKLTIGDLLLKYPVLIAAGTEMSRELRQLGFTVHNGEERWGPSPLREVYASWRQREDIKKRMGELV